jgi:hypothetical protein
MPRFLYRHRTPKPWKSSCAERKPSYGPIDHALIIEQDASFLLSHGRRGVLYACKTREGWR